MKRAIAAFLAMLAPAIAGAALRPAAHGDFGHYTFALTWQPGICGTDGGCSSDQPRTVSIGLHGLWASRPHALIEKGVTDREWWSRGCAYYTSTNAAPPISASLQRALNAVMPHFRDSLLTHEYDKHVACFGFNVTTFFSTELAMRRAVVAGAFGRYLMSRAGRTVTHSALSRHFTSAFSTDKRASLQLRCERNAAGQTVLTQFWITIRTDEVNRFPNGSSLMNALTDQDTCPPVFLVPAWR